MATVDLAEDTRLGRLVALKRMGGAVDVSGLSRLRREALAGASLNHPNLVSVYDVLTLEDGELIIVMEYVQGETLRDRLAREGRLAPTDALPLLAGAAAGLDAIHGAGIVHRDVKPSNILLGEDGAVKVADLGVASVPDRTQITTTGSIIGSLVYMAPEQLEPGPSPRHSTSMRSQRSPMRCSRVSRPVRPRTRWRSRTRSRRSPRRASGRRGRRPLAPSRTFSGAGCRASLGSGRHPPASSSPGWRRASTRRPPRREPPVAHPESSRRVRPRQPPCPGEHPRPAASGFHRHRPRPGAPLPPPMTRTGGGGLSRPWPWARWDWRCC